MKSKTSKHNKQKLNMQNSSTCFITLKELLNVNKKNLCMHLIKQINNNCVK